MMLLPEEQRLDPMGDGISERLKGRGVVTFPFCGLVGGNEGSGREKGGQEASETLVW